MSATRLLVLWTVRKHGMAHGYLISGDLEAVWAPEWAKLKSGSIYHALRQLTKDGLLEAFQREEWPGRVDHRITTTGETEFHRLLRDALRRPDPRPDLKAAALLLLTELSRDEAVELLEERLRAEEAECEKLANRVTEQTEPETVADLLAMLRESADRNAAWTRGLLDRLRAGDFEMAASKTA